jgi:hypothetical protein
LVDIGLFSCVLNSYSHEQKSSGFCWQSLHFNSRPHDWLDWTDHKDPIEHADQTCYRRERESPKQNHLSPVQRIR